MQNLTLRLWYQEMVRYVCADPPYATTEEGDNMHQEKILWLTKATLSTQFWRWLATLR